MKYSVNNYYYTEIILSKRGIHVNYTTLYPFPPEIVSNDLIIMKITASYPDTLDNQFLISSTIGVTCKTPSLFLNP